MTPEIIIPKIIRNTSAAALLFVAAIFVIPTVSSGDPQSSAASQNSMPGMGMGDMQGMQNNSDAANAATGAMSAMSDPTMQGMNMNLHMHMTDLRPANSADEKRADDILAQLRPAIEKYKDYHVALADGFRIFGPNVPQPIYHFTNYRYAVVVAFKFDPTRPTSLLYKKTATGYELVGVMYTAPKRFSEEQLNARVPLSVARWHEHVNLCLPPRGTSSQQIDWKEFGPNGTIATESACEAAGGRWYPQIFGWMVHVYPFETDPNRVWAH
jgi:hypothetical protein